MTIPAINDRERGREKKRVWCLYRVSTRGQVDKDDIPMQRLSAHEFIDHHPDWEFVKELQEKGVSGYKLKSSERDILTEVMEAAAAKQFDILLVFMFDRLGRRDDETPFIARWFVEQGIEVWSVKEGQQRFDSHVDSLIAYIHYWQAAGESIKTAMRVRERQSQMIAEGLYRGGLVAYGYNTNFEGRVNKKGHPVRDYSINEEQADVIKTIYHKIVDEGYGTHRLANWLNEQGIPTKRGNYHWRATAIRAIIENPIYVGVLRFGKELSPPFEQLRIISDFYFMEALKIVKSRAPKISEEREKPMRTDGRGLLTGIIYCAECGNRMTFNHQKTVKETSLGLREYERDMYRCYRKLDHTVACTGQSTYNIQRIDEPVLAAVRQFFKNVTAAPKEGMLKKAVDREKRIRQQLIKKAEQDMSKAQREVAALEDALVKALTGESSLDVDFLNQAIQTRRGKLRDATDEYERLKVEFEADERLTGQRRDEMQRLSSWAQSFESASFETKKMILAHLIERVEVSRDYQIEIKFRLSMKQFIGEAA